MKLSLNQEIQARKGKQGNFQKCELFTCCLFIVNYIILSIIQYIL